MNTSLFPQQPQSSLATGDEVIGELFKLIDRREKIANLVDAFEKARNLPFQHRQSVYIILYSALEKFLTTQRPPIVKAQFSRDELRRYVRQRVNINDLAVEFKIFFVPPIEQSILLFYLAVRDVLTYLETNLGAQRVKKFFASSVKGTMFESPWREEIVLNSVEGMFREASRNEVITSLAAILRELLDDVRKFFGQKIATSVLRKSFQFVSQKYGDDLMTLYLAIIPQEYFLSERFSIAQRITTEKPSFAPDTPTMGESEQAVSIAQTRAADEQLRQERDLTRAIVDSIGDGVLVVDRNDVIISLNPTAAHFLGVSRRDAIGYHQQEVFTIYKNGTQIPESESLTRRVLSTGNSITYELEENIVFKTKKDKEVPVELTASPLWKNTVSIEEGITGCVIIFTDATEAKKLDYAKSNFLSVASHELRTPLTAMQWFLEMLLSGDAGDLTEDQKALVKKSYESSEHMANLVNYLLQVVRVETGRMKINPVEVNFTEMTKKTILQVQQELAQKKQQFEVEADSASLPKVLLDHDMIQQVLRNLLSNASYYSPDESKIITRVTYNPQRQEVQYAIQDFGIGIPDREKEFMFHKFFRASNAIKAYPNGTGVGLWLARILIEKWGGKIWFDTQEGKGSTFYFSIPQRGMTA